MNILVINCGSSSIKYQLIHMQGDDHSVVAKGLVERIGLEDSVFVHKPAEKPGIELTKKISDHTVGINLILRYIADDDFGVVKSLSDVAAVGHRIAHGGEYFSDSVIITESVKRKIEACIPLAPLHNPANLKGILAIERLLPYIPQVAVFDTSFHQTITREHFLYGIPYKYYEEERIRKYGFHGSSHRYVCHKACEKFGIDIENSKIISCHLGNGASVTAIKNGRVIDTSMGFTPVDGLLMGSRCGAIDPSVLIYIAQKEEKTLSKMSKLINNESGLLGVGGVSTDIRDNIKAAEEGNSRAQLALDMFSLRVKKYVGEYTALLGGADLIIFTGGIGENCGFIREDVCDTLQFMGVHIDPVENAKRFPKSAIITTPESTTKVAVVPTNEELVIATDTYHLLCD